MQLSAHRFRWIFITCLVTLGVSAGVVGTVLIARWQEDRATTADTRAMLDRAARELSQLLQNRRATLRLLRSALDKAPGLDASQRVALARSAQVATADLSGCGAVDSRGAATWWAPPAPVGSLALSRLTQHVTQRHWLQTTARQPATLIVFLDVDRPVLVMSEPLRARAHTDERVMAIFDVRSLLPPFFKRTLARPYPVRVMEGAQELYRSNRWVLSGGRRAVIERPVKDGRLHWTLQMRAGPVPVVPRSWMNILVATVFLLAGLAVLGMIWIMEHLGRLASTDSLTGLPNRRFFLERWEGECERAKRYHRHLSCLMIDMKGFKQVNDLLGHHTGDQVLKAVARTLTTHLRRTDLVARFGGDEFIVALTETRAKDAAAVADKLRALSIDGPWSRDRRLDTMSLSVGVSELRAEESPEQAIQRADADLYASRQIPRQLLTT